MDSANHSLAETDETVRAFTTRPDTLFGATLFVLAPVVVVPPRLVDLVTVG